MKLPPPETITPTPPLRLEVAAELGFPDGLMTASSLRRLAVAQKIDHEKIAGRYYITLAAIEEMRDRCRVRAKAPVLPSKEQKTESQPGSSETDSAPSAQAAANAIAEELIENLRNTSSKSMTRKKRSAKVIRMASR